MFSPATLFEGWRSDPAAYPTDAANLDAIRAGNKPLSMFHVDDARAITALARARDLVVVVHPPRVFVTRPEELWRIPAFLALWETAFVDGAWSDAAEAQQSLLLGYSRAQRAAWLARQRAQHAAWGCPTIYALLTPAQRRAVRAVGQRCLGAADQLDGLTLLFHLGGVLKRRAHALVPAGLTLARAALEPGAFRALFGTPKWTASPRLVTATIPRRLAASTNAGLRSSVQLLTRRGWR